ncbi:hypothetical protein HanRHA438_Chr10g0440741 [Helianthus annuus]|nr:hypothetical protein HanRHA438_Chr10g0440741 [Helianthus annuus]
MMIPNKKVLVPLFSMTNPIHIYIHINRYLVKERDIRREEAAKDQEEIDEVGVIKASIFVFT